MALDSINESEEIPLFSCISDMLNSDALSQIERG